MTYEEKIQAVLEEIKCDKYVEYLYKHRRELHQLATKEETLNSESISNEHFEAQDRAFQKYKCKKGIDIAIDKDRVWRIVKRPHQL